MAYKKITLRRLPSKTRELARLINDLESVARRLKNYLPEVKQLESDSHVLERFKPTLEQYRKALDEDAKKNAEPLFPNKARTSKEEEI